MKIILSTILFVISFAANGQKEINYYDFDFKQVKKRKAAFKQEVYVQDGIKTSKTARIYNKNLFYEKKSFNSGKQEEVKVYYFNGVLNKIRSINNETGYEKQVVLRVNGDTSLIKEYLKDQYNGFYKRYKTVDGKSKLIYLVTYLNGQKNGKCINYYPSGNILDSCFYKNDTIVGEQYTYHDNGKVESIISYVNGLKQGTVISYDDMGYAKSESFYSKGELNGKLTYYSNDEGVIGFINYKKGKRHGKHVRYWDNGVQSRDDLYENGYLVDGKCYDHKGNDTTYFYSESMPMYPGGEEELYKYLGKNIRYPSQAKLNNMQGRIYIEFVVEKDGAISDVEELNYIGAGLNKESFRVIKEMPNWIPGTQRGKKVRVKYTLPILYQLK